jgi:hypothetical protein
VGVVSETARLYKPIKRTVTIRLDADVIAWFKQHAPNGHYQTEINRILRQHATGSASWPSDIWLNEAEANRLAALRR